MKLSAIRVNGAAIDGGAWVAVPMFDGLEFHVRGLEYVPYQRARAEKIRAMQLQAKAASQLPENLNVKPAEVEAFVDHCLLGWRGLEGDDGSPVEFDADKAKAMLLDPDMIDFWTVATWAASEVRRVKTETAEAERGN